MKRTFLKSALPVFAIALSVLGAFAFKPAPKSAVDALVFGAVKVGGTCVQIDKECQTDTSEHPCFSGSNQLWRFNSSTSCPNMLYEIE